MHRYAEGSLGNVDKNSGIPYKNQYCSCIAMPREPSEMLKKHGIPYKDQYFSCIAMPRAPSEC